MFIGIDIGVKGGIAFLTEEEGLMRVKAIDLPQTCPELEEAFRGISGVKLVLVEQPLYLGGNSSQSTGKVGEGFGRIRAALYFLGYPMKSIHPATWKKAMGVTKDKSAARASASSLFPHDAHQWARVKDDGRAEAALIAMHAAKIF